MTDPEPSARKYSYQGRLDEDRRVMDGSVALARVLGAPAEALPAVCFDELVSRRDRTGLNRYNELVATLAPGDCGDAFVTLELGGQRRLCHIDLSRRAEGWDVAVRDVPDGSALHQLVVSDEQRRGLLRGTDDGVAILDSSLRIVELNETFLSLLQVAQPDGVRLACAAVRGSPLFELPLPDPVMALESRLQVLRRTVTTSVRMRGRKLDLTITPLSISARVSVGACLVVRDDTARDEVARLARDAARSAGMAEVATGVLHNVGNALCSVRTSSAVIAGRAKASAVGKLGRLCGLLDEQQDLGAFFSSNKGRATVDFLRGLRDSLGDDREAVLGELQSLLDAVDHITSVVSSQNQLARASAQLETLQAPQLVASSEALVRSTYEELGVQLETRGAAGVTVVVDRHRIVQVVTNLLRNAAQAVRDAGIGDGRVVLQQAVEGEDWVVTVTDNGVGFSAEVGSRIFQHGFTTKDDGNGFGLHDSANICRSLGGTLSARSDGPGCGASFEMRLPAAGPGHSETKLAS